MAQLGNEKTNRFFECNASSNEAGISKPDALSEDGGRKAWITAKYAQKLFVPPLSPDYDLQQPLASMVGRKAFADKEGKVVPSVILLFYGAVDQADKDGKTLLMHAAMSDQWLIAQALVLHGSDIFARDSQDWTAFHYACFYNNYRTLQVLVRQGLREAKNLSFLREGEDSSEQVAERYNARECLMLIRGEIAMSYSTLDRLLQKSLEGPLDLEVYQAITSPEMMEEEKHAQLDLPLLSAEVSSEDISWRRGQDLSDRPERTESRKSIHQLSMFLKGKSKTEVKTAPRSKKISLKRRPKSVCNREGNEERDQNGIPEQRESEILLATGFEDSDSSIGTPAPERTEESEDPQMGEETLFSDELVLMECGDLQTAESSVETPELGASTKRTESGGLMNLVDTESEEESSSEDEVPTDTPPPPPTLVTLQGFDFPTST